jgi:hypothetical protein
MSQIGILSGSVINFTDPRIQIRTKKYLRMRKTAYPAPALSRQETFSLRVRLLMKFLSSYPILQNPQDYHIVCSPCVAVVELHFTGFI